MKEGYLPLYRKYRPQKLEDIVGQSHIKTALTNAINLDKVAHAYLFTGPRGTGKTSTARILAKSLNCVNGPTVTPCDECESCKAVINTVPVDVIEIDAASNRSVEDARNILEKVQYAPVSGKHKIYIIDEVHMLTPQAFNALLKILEEPPKNVIFILATTEAHKVLDTIKSRCQRFDFKRITTGDIIEHLKKIAEKEKIKISEGAISLIAKSSSGGMRDSLALLDQVSLLGIQKEITEDDINNMLGRLSFDILKELAELIAASDPVSAINLLEKIYNDGNEPVQILTNLMMFFKNVLIAKTCNLDITIELTGLNDVQVNSLNELKNKLETHQILFLINKTAEYIKELKETTNQQMWLEVSLIDLANLSNNTKLLELQSRLDELELSRGTVTSRPTVNISPILSPQGEKSETKPQNVQDSNPEPEKETNKPDADEITVNIDNMSKADNAVESENSGTDDIKSLWVQILRAIPHQSDQALLTLANPVKLSADGIIITFKTPSFVQKANTQEKRQCISDAAASILGKKDIPVTIREPLADDKKIEAVKIAPAKKSTSPSRDLVDEPQEITEHEMEMLSGEAKKKNNNTSNEDVDYSHSEQSNMVKQLFDGKYLD